MDESTARQRSRTYSSLAQRFSEVEPGLEQEFARLFLGPGRPVAHPYESVYREGCTMGETTLDVRRRMAREGVAPNGGVLADHVAIELAFMAHLSAREALAWEATDTAEAWHRLRQQESFLREHLGTWLPQFCHRILAGRPLAHFVQLAQSTEAFVSSDALSLQAWLGGSTYPDEGEVVVRQRWNVVIGKQCTLCQICVGVCHPRALQAGCDKSEGLVSLELDQARCDGCAACVRWCPEEAVSLAPVKDERPDSVGTVAQSRLLFCPRCGRLNVSQAMVAKIEAQLGQAKEALLERLLLCQDCKVSDVPGLHLSAGRRSVTRSS